MNTLLKRPGPRRRALIVPVAIGVSLMASACASDPRATDPYLGSAPMTEADEAKEFEAPNSGAAAALKRGGGEQPQSKRPDPDTAGTTPWHRCIRRVHAQRTFQFLSKL
jgi:hypothetical protein